MANRKDLFHRLTLYKNTWAAQKFERKPESLLYETSVLERFSQFIRNHPQCFERSNTFGHVTGSALVVNSDLTKVLLTHHRKLNLWLQLGGHADGHPIAHEVALNEALEESGLTGLSVLNYERDLFGTEFQEHIPFDIDLHAIPANAKDPGHFHYDVRFLILAENDRPPVVSDESHDVAWFTLTEARKITSETSMHRQFDKVEWIKNRLRV